MAAAALYARKATRIAAAVDGIQPYPSFELDTLVSGTA